LKRSSGEDDFWTHQFPLFAAQFPAYYTKLQKVWGRVHTSEEQYFDTRHEIIPIKQKNGIRTYVMMQPYVLEPKLTMTVGLYPNPKTYHDQDSAIGEVVDTQQQGFRAVQLGNAQAWYYHQDRTIVLWECFFDGRFRRTPLVEDRNMQHLWQSFEHYLLHQFPEAKLLATPFNDPIAETIDEYQAFLTSLGYAAIAQAAFGKAIA
jgi:hypothetical protein